MSTLKLEALLNISQIDFTEPLNPLLEDILIIVGREMQAHSGSVMLVNEETGELDLVATFGLPDDYIDRVYARGVPITCSPSGEVMKTGKYYVVPNIFEEPREKWWADLARDLGFSAQLFMPMEHKGEIIGLLNIYMAEPHEYTPDEITFVSIAASQAAAMIEHARLYSTVTKEKKMLEGEIDKHRRVEELLWESRETLRNILSASPIGIGMVKDRKLYWTNDRMLEMMGFTPDDDPYEYVGQSAEVIYASKEEYERVGLIFYEGLKESDLVAVDAKLKRRDGSTFDGHIKMSFLDSSDPMKGAIATISDITWRKQAEEQLKASEEKFRIFMDTARDLMHITDKDGNFVYVNKSMARTLGYSKEELLGMNATQILTKESLSEYFEPWWNTLITKGELTIDAVWVTKDGSRIYGELKAVAIYDEDGTFVGSRAVFHDTTEHKRLEEELRQSEVLYRTFFEVTNAPTVILNEDGTFYKVNREGAKISGFTKEELEGKKRWTEFIARKEDLEKMKEIHRLRRDDPDSALDHYEFLFKDRYGNLRNIYVAAAIIPGTKRSAVSFMDITERKRAETALRVSEERFRSLLQNAADIIVVLNPTGIVQYVSPSVERILGYKPEDLLGKNGFVVFYPEDVESAQAAFAETIKQPGVNIDVVFRAIRPDGSLLYLQLIGRNLLDDPKINGILINARDVTGRIIGERALMESEERFRSLFDNLSVGITMLDREGQILAVNKTACRFLDYSQEELIGMPFTTLIHTKDLEVDREPFKPVIAGEKDHCLMDKRYVRKDGKVVWGRLHASGIKDKEGQVKFISLICEDITACKLVEEALVSKSAEMASVIAKCKHMKEALQRSETKYKEIAEFLPDIIYKSILLDA